MFKMFFFVLFLILVADHARASLKLGRDILKINILNKFHEDWIKPVHSRVCTKCFEDLNK